jgi:hypothetical protein
MTSLDGFHELEDSLYGAGDVRLAAGREARAREAWPPARGAAGASHTEPARHVTWRESERVLSLQRLMGG